MYGHDTESVPFGYRQNRETAMRLPALMIVAALVLTSTAFADPWGGNGNCVRVVKALTGFGGRAHNGRGFASSLLRSRMGYRVVSIRSRKRGMVCSWNEIGGGPGHVGRFDGRCFQPVFPNSPCGDPGKRYLLSLCVARN
jgi:hypothetical protein